MAKFAKRLFAGALAAAVALTTVISSDMTALAAKTKATKIKGSTYTTADLIWEDNFNGNKLNTRYWNYEAHEPGWVNQEWQSYPSQEENEKTQNIYVKDGKLTIQAKKTKNEDGTYSYTSGRINTQNKVDTKYGRFEARIKMPKGKGFLPAFWMMPTDENLYGQWPKCGEIDITEVLGDKPNTAHSTLHFGEPHKQKQGTYTLEKGTFNDDFHVYACEWEPGEMRFYIDNKLFYTENDWFTKKEGFDEVAYPAPYDQPFYIILNLAVGGSWVGYPDKTTKFDENAQMVVDYVKVYQKDSYKENVKKPENKVTVRKPAKDGNYVVNSSFAKSEKLNDGKDWEFMTAGTGKASAKISKKALHITTKNAGDLDYSVQVVQANIPMEKGYQYKLSFDAYADKNRTIKTGITAPDNGYIRYFNDTTVNLTTKKKTYSYTFDMKSDTDPNGRVEFNLGNQGSTAGVHISNVKVVRVKKISLKEEKTVRPDGNYVYNGEFQEGADRLNYWTVKKAKGVTVKVTNTNNVRQLKAVVPASVKKASDVTLKQTKIAIKGGKTYAFSFDAKRTGAKDQTMTVKLAGKTYKVKLTGKMKNYKFELNPDKGIKNATLEFQLGTKGTTVIDNVRIMESGLIINGDFSAGLTGFEPWANNPSDISYVVDTLNEDSAFCMDIKDTGDQDWHVQLKQTGIKLEKGQSYKVSFKVKGTMERDIKFAFQRNGLVRKTADGAEDWTVYFEDGQIPVTKKWTTYSAIFEMGEGDDADTSMSFSLGAVGGKRITDKHTVMIDDIVLEKTDEKPEKEEDDSLILNGHFNKGLAPFEAWAHEAATMESSVNKDKEFEATISNTGDQDWHVQLKQVNIPLESGQTYTFSFRAKSDMDREIKYAFQKDGNKHNDDWTVYFEESNIPVTKEWKTYTTVFKMNNASDKEASFSFNLGAVGKQIKEKHTVMIDDVSLKVATEEEKKQAKKNETSGGVNIVYPGLGDGTGTKKGLMDTVDKWVKPDASLATVTTSEDNALNVKMTSVGTVPESVRTAIPFSMPEDGSSAIFKATLTSDVSKRVTISNSKTNDKAVYDLAPGVATDVTLAITPVVRTMSLRSARLMAAEETAIYIDMGKHEGENETLTPEISIVADAVVSASLVSEKASYKNGWKIDKWGNGEGTLTTEENSVTIHTTNVGSRDDQLKLVKTDLMLVNGLDYKVSFDITSDKNRAYKWGLIDHTKDDKWNWYGGEDRSFTDENNRQDHIEYSFTCVDDDKNVRPTSTSIQFYISLGQIGENTPGKATITLSNLSIKVVPKQNYDASKDNGEGGSTEDVAGNMLSDGTFGKEGAWYLYKEASGAASVQYAKNQADIMITDRGNAAHHVQLQQKLTLQQNHKYAVKCKVKSDVARTVHVALQGGSEVGYATFGAQTVLFSAEEAKNGKVKEISFEATCDTALTNQASFNVNMGKIAGDAEDMGEHHVKVSSASVVDITSSTEKDPEETPSTPDGGLLGNPYTRENWTVVNVAAESASSSAIFKSDKVIFNITNVGKQSYGVQLSKDLKFKKDYTYQVTCTVSSSAIRTISTQFQNKDGYKPIGSAPSAAASITFTEDRINKEQTISYDVKCTGDVENGCFQINMGKFDDENPGSHTITLTNISVKEIAPATPTLGSHTITISNISVKEKDGAQELLIAQPGDAWGQYIANDQGAAGTITFENDKATAAITNVGTADWNVQMKTPAIQFEAGKTYTISFQIKSTASRKIKIAVMAEGDQWYGGTDIDLTENNNVTVTKDITLETKNESNRTNDPKILQFSLGKVAI